MSYDFHTEKTVVARKSHDCVESHCARGISQGDSYVKVAGAYDGDFYYVKLCARCHRAHERVRKRYPDAAYGDDVPAYGDLLAWLTEERRR